MFLGPEEDLLGALDWTVPFRDSASLACHDTNAHLLSLPDMQETQQLQSTYNPCSFVLF